MSGGSAAGDDRAGPPAGEAPDTIPRPPGSTPVHDRAFRPSPPFRDRATASASSRWFATRQARLAGSLVLLFVTVTLLWVIVISIVTRVTAFVD